MNAASRALDERSGTGPRRPPDVAASIAVAALVLVADQLTKHWAVNALDDGHAIDVVGSLRFKLFFNSGMAFSRGEGAGPVIGVVALIVVTVLLLSLRRSGGRLALVATGLVIGGAAGNIADRLFRDEGWLRGRVVDFIDLQWWPVFNVADMGVTIGGALIVLNALLAGRGAALGRHAGTVIEERIPAALAGERLDRIVSIVAEISRADAAALIVAGGARVDGAVCTSGKQRIGQDALVSVDDALVPHDALPEPDPSIAVHVLHRDEHLVIVDKQAGLVVHPGAGNPRGTLVDGLLAAFPQIAAVGDPHRPGIVHRLDVGTSGAMVVALTQQAYGGLVAQLSSRAVHRSYLALVWGHPDSPNGVVDVPVGRDHRDPTRMAVVVGGRPARTAYAVRTTFDEPLQAALVECRLETGRTHQIRVHMAAIGHPVAGDATYGGQRAGVAVPRPFLHAAVLELEHPVTGEPLRAEAPLPDDLASVLARFT